VTDPTDERRDPELDAPEDPAADLHVPARVESSLLFEVRRVGPGFADHRRPLDPWNEITPPELPDDEEDAVLADVEIAVLPIDDELPEVEALPLEPELDPGLDPGLDAPPNDLWAADLYSGDGPFAAPLDVPHRGGVGSSAGRELLSSLPRAELPREPPVPDRFEARPSRPPVPRAPSLLSDLAAEFAAPIMVERRVPNTDAEVTEAEVVAVPRVPAVPQVSAIPSSLAPRSGPTSPASTPPSRAGAALLAGLTPEPAPTPAAPPPQSSLARRPGVQSGPSPRATAPSSQPSGPAAPHADRAYPMMRALLKSPDEVPYGVDPPRSRRAQPVPGTFFPTVRRDRDRPIAPQDPADLDDLLATMAEGLLIGESPSGGTEVRVTLRDEFFAGTELRITMNDGRVRAVLVPPDRGTYLTLNGNIDDLRLRLEARGLRVEELRVAEP
jgi:hypothetical protein